MEDGVLLVPIDVDVDFLPDARLVAGKQETCFIPVKNRPLPEIPTDVGSVPKWQVLSGLGPNRALLVLGSWLIAALKEVQKSNSPGWEERTLICNGIGLLVNEWDWIGAFTKKRSYIPSASSPEQAKQSLETHIYRTILKKICELEDMELIEDILFHLAKRIRCWQMGKDGGHRDLKVDFSPVRAPDVVIGRELHSSYSSTQAVENAGVLIKCSENGTSKEFAWHTKAHLQGDLRTLLSQTPTNSKLKRDNRSILLAVFGYHPDILDKLITPEFLDLHQGETMTRELALKNIDKVLVGKHPFRLNVKSFVVSLNHPRGTQVEFSYLKCVAQISDRNEHALDELMATFQMVYETFPAQLVSKAAINLQQICFQPGVGTEEYMLTYVNALGYLMTHSREMLPELPKLIKNFIEAVEQQRYTMKQAAIVSRREFDEWREFRIKKIEDAIAHIPNPEDAARLVETLRLYQQDIKYVKSEFNRYRSIEDVGDKMIPTINKIFLKLHHWISHFLRCPLSSITADTLEVRHAQACFSSSTEAFLEDSVFLPLSSDIHANHSSCPSDSVDSDDRTSAMKTILKTNTPSSNQISSVPVEGEQVKEEIQMTIGEAYTRIFVGTLNQSLLDLNPNAYAFHYIPRSNKFAPDQQLTERDELLPSVRPPELISPKYLSLTPFLIASWFHEGRSKSSSQRLGNIENAYIESLIRIAGTFDDLGVKSMDRRVNAVSLAVSFLISSKQLGCFDKISYIQRLLGIAGETCTLTRNCLLGHHKIVHSDKPTLWKLGLLISRSLVDIFVFMVRFNSHLDTTSESSNIRNHYQKNKSIACDDWTMLSDDFNLRLTSEAYIKGSIPWTESLVRSALNLKSEAAITPMGILAFEWMLVFKNTIDLFNYGMTSILLWEPITFLSMREALALPIYPLRLIATTILRCMRFAFCFGPSTNLTGKIRHQYDFELPSNAELESFVPIFGPSISIPIGGVNTALLDWFTIPDYPTDAMVNTSSSIGRFTRSEWSEIVKDEDVINTTLNTLSFRWGLMLDLVSIEGAERILKDSYKLAPIELLTAYGRNRHIQGIDKSYDKFDKWLRNRAVALNSGSAVLPGISSLEEDLLISFTAGNEEESTSFVLHYPNIAAETIDEGEVGQLPLKEVLVYVTVKRDIMEPHLARFSNALEAHNFSTESFVATMKSDANQLSDQSKDIPMESDANQLSDQSDDIPVESDANQLSDQSDDIPMESDTNQLSDQSDDIPVESDTNQLSDQSDDIPVESDTNQLSDQSDDIPVESDAKQCSDKAQKKLANKERKRIQKLNKKLLKKKLRKIDKKTMKLEKKIIELKYKMR